MFHFHVVTAQIAPDSVVLRGRRAVRGGISKQAGTHISSNHQFKEVKKKKRKKGEKKMAYFFIYTAMSPGRTRGH